MQVWVYIRTRIAVIALPGSPTASEQEITMLILSGPTHGVTHCGPNPMAALTEMHAGKSFRRQTTDICWSAEPEVLVQGIMMCSSSGRIQVEISFFRNLLAERVMT